MRLTISAKKSLIALSGGIFACVCAYFLWIFSIICILNPIVALLNYAWYDNVLLYFSINSLIEEGIKLFFIRCLKIYSWIFFGFFYGITEIIIRNWEGFRNGYPLIYFREFSFILHILTASILVYSIKKKKMVWGLVAAIIIHTLWNYGITRLFA